MWSSLPCHPNTLHVFHCSMCSSFLCDPFFWHIHTNLTYTHIIVTYTHISMTYTRINMTYINELSVLADTRTSHGSVRGVQTATWRTQTAVEIRSHRSWYGQRNFDAEFSWNFWNFCDNFMKDFIEKNLNYFSMIRSVTSPRRVYSRNSQILKIFW